MAHENSITCTVQHDGRGSAGGRGTELVMTEKRKISMVDIALERSRGEERREMAESTLVAGSTRTWSLLRWRRMREDDEKSSDVV